MKLKRVPFLLFLLFSLSLASFSQVEDEEVMMFSVQGQPSLTRGALTKQMLDFGIIKKEAKILKIDIKNPGKADLKIGRIAVPEGVGIFVLNEIVKPGEKGVIAVMVDPKYLKEGNFKKEIIISVTTEEKKVLVTRTVVFDLKGQVL
jgi:hypothetical protein